VATVASLTALWGTAHIKSNEEQAWRAKRAQLDEELKELKKQAKLNTSAAKIYPAGSDYYPSEGGSFGDGCELISKK